MSVVKLRCDGCCTEPGDTVMLNIYHVWVLDGAWRESVGDWLPGLRGLYGWRCLCGHVGEAFIAASHVRQLAACGAAVRPDTANAAVREAAAFLADDDLVAAAINDLKQQMEGEA